MRGLSSLVEWFLLLIPSTNGTLTRFIVPCMVLVRLSVRLPLSLDHGGGERAMLNVLYGSGEVCEQAACA